MWDKDKEINERGGSFNMERKFGIEIRKQKGLKTKNPGQAGIFIISFS